MAGDVHGKTRKPVGCAVLTISDTRTIATDRSGDRIVELLGQHAHRVVRRSLVGDEPAAVRAEVELSIAEPAVAAVIATGGTGVAPRDRTVEVLEALFERRLPGFGELFRLLSYQQIGAAAMLSRATAGVCRGTAIFALPGSTAAIELALERLILPELSHLVHLVRGE